MFNPYRTFLYVAQTSMLLGSCYLAALVVGDLTRLWSAPSSPSRLEAAPQAGGPVHHEARFLHPSQIRLLAGKGPHVTQAQSASPRKPPTPQATHRRCDPNAPTKVSSLRWTLQGTSVAEPASYSTAAIYDHQRRRRVLLSVGQRYRDVSICGITAKSIHISRGPGREELLVMGVSPRLLPRHYAAITLRRIRRRTRRRKHSIWRRRWRRRRWQRQYKQVLSSIERRSRDHYTLPRRWVRPLARHYRFLQKQATILPYFRQGQAMGLRILKPKPNSIFRKLGLQSGDIIRSINGVTLSDHQRVVHAYYQLRSASNFSVQIFRNGRHHTVRYDLRG